MKTLFMEARSSVDLILSDEALLNLKDFSSSLGNKVGLITTVQHCHKIFSLKEQLVKNGFSVFTGRGFRTKHEAQILGCDVGAATSIKEKVDFFIYVGTGRFHPIAVSVATNKPVLKYNPFTKQLAELSLEEVDKYKKHVRAGQVAFLSSHKIGILLTEKSGQRNFELAMLLKEKIKNAGKKPFVLAFDTLDFSQLENFPFIECFVNTACPRLIDDYLKFPRPVVNASDIMEFLS